MKRKASTRRVSLFLLLAALSASLNPGLTTRAVPFLPSPAAVAAQSERIRVNGFFNVDPAQRGRTFQAAIVMEIPEDLHVNANRPLGKYAIPTTVKVEAPRGIRTSAVSYPRAVVRSFKFDESGPADRLAVYEGRALMRFSVTVPPDFPQGVTKIRVRVHFQSCSDTVCYPPATRNLELAIGIVGTNDPVERINGQYFGGGARRRGK
jgi:hypothetical protein